MISTEKYNYNQQLQSLRISLTQKVRGLCFVFMILAVFANFSGNRANAQDTTISVPKTAPTEIKAPHSPRKATLLALVLPGAGQVYNHKYWKVPVF